MSETFQDVSAGTLLRRARESAGLHVAALAVALKVPVRKLEALEADRYAELPDAVFARALASSVCRNLKIDPRPVLDRLPQTAAPRLARTQDSINAPFRSPGEASGAGWKEQLRRPVPLTVLALLLGAVVLMFLPDFRREPVAAAPAPEPAAAPMASPVVLQPSSEPAAAGAAPGTPASESVQAETPSGPGPAVAAPPAPAGAAGASSTPAGAAAGTVVFRASAPSWIQVTDAKGVVALRRQLEAGESAGASGTPPLAVTVGSAGATTVEVRGKAFDLAPVTRDNVARFEVK